MLRHPPLLRIAANLRNIPVVFGFWTSDDLWKAASGVHLTTQFAYQNSLGTCNAPLCVSYSQQIALEIGHEARIVQIDFNEAFWRVNYQGIFYKLYPLLDSSI